MKFQPIKGNNQWATRTSVIKLQDGPVREHGINGDQIDDVILFCRDRLIEFNVEPYFSVKTDLAIAHLERTLKLLAQRTEDRERRGVEGTSTP